MSLLVSHFPTFKYNSIESLPGSMLFKMETPQCIRKKGSLTVEASLILPMLACFFTFLLFFFHILLTQLTVQEALEDTGRILAVMAETELSQDDPETINYAVLAKTLLTTKLSGEEEINRFVTGGVLGITLLTSEWDKDDLVLEVNYAMKFPVDLLGKRYIWMTQRTSFRKWIGWHAINQSDAAQMTVYITKNGTAYHKRKSCPYLALSIRSVKQSEINNLRNHDGKRYWLCEICGGEEKSADMVYITDYGIRYHTKRSCSGLKRTVYEVDFSEVGGRHACPKCWK